VNACASNLKVLPLEFYILWTDFEPWKPVDTITINFMMAKFLSFDYPIELMRHKLSRVYPMSIVNKLYAWKTEDTYFGDRSLLIPDEELKKQGFYDESASIYEVDPNLMDYHRKANGDFYSAEDLKDAYL
jgi:hypothetical protein